LVSEHMVYEKEQKGFLKPLENYFQNQV